MDINTVYQRKVRQVTPDGWLDVWTMERQTMDHAAANLANLVDGLAKVVKSLVRRIAGLRRTATVPARVVSRPVSVSLTARNDDRAAA